jgi:hypothetical protein
MISVLVALLFVCAGAEQAHLRRMQFLRRASDPESTLHASDANTDHCAIPKDLKFEKGVKLVIDDNCDESDDKYLWKMEERSGGYVRFRSVYDNNMCIQAGDTEVREGTKARLYPCSSSSRQRFKFDGDRLKVKKNTKLCMVYHGLNLEDGDNIVFNDCDKVDDQVEDGVESKGWSFDG